MKTPRLILALILTFTFQLSIAENVIDIYQPSHKSASELQQTLSKLYGEEANIVAQDGQLIIRAEHGTVNQIQELLLQLDKGTGRYSVTISTHPVSATAKVYSTRHSNNLQTFNISAGKTLTIVKEQQEQRVTGTGWLMLDIETVPSQQESLTITLKTVGHTVTLDVDMQTLKNGEFTSINSTLQGVLGEWIPLAAGTRHTHNRGTRSVGTKRSNSSELYIKVSEQ